MLTSITVKVSAGNVNSPLPTASIIVGSAATVGVLDVPRVRLGCTITGVSVSIENPQGTISTVAASAAGNVWSATFPASHFAYTGSVTDGLVISLTGKDATGTTRTWIVGKGNVRIIAATPVPTPGTTATHLTDQTFQGDTVNIATFDGLSAAVTKVLTKMGATVVSCIALAITLATSAAVPSGYTNDTYSAGGVTYTRTGALNPKSSYVVTETSGGSSTNDATRITDGTNTVYANRTVVGVTNVPATSVVWGKGYFTLTGSRSGDIAWWDDIAEYRDNDKDASGPKLYKNGDGDVFFFCDRPGLMVYYEPISMVTNYWSGEGAEEGQVWYLTYHYTVPTPTTNTLAVTADIPTAQVASNAQAITFWDGYWQGDRVRLSVTNYYGNTSGELPRLRIEESVTNASGEVTSWRTVWDEVNKYTNLEQQVYGYMRTATNDIALATWRMMNAGLATAAPRAWGSVTSAGESAPNNTVWMTAPNTVFAGGTEYAHISAGEGTICVLANKGAGVYTDGEEGKFRFQDDSGTYYFGFDVMAGYTLGCNTDGITTTEVSGNVLVTLNYNLTSQNRPVIEHTTNLTGTVVWTQLDAEDVSWSDPSAGVQQVEINAGANPSGFYRAKMEYSGTAKMLTNMPFEPEAGILATNTVNNVMQKIRPKVGANNVVTWEVIQ